MNCYLCSTPMKFFLHKRGYDLLKCPACALVMTDLKKEYEPFVRKFYQRGYFTGDETCGAYAQYEEDKRYITRNWKHHIDVIEKIKSKGKLLDVGCAMGFFVEKMDELGYDAYGFDPSDFAVSHAPKYLNGHLQTGTVASVEYPKNTFDVITMLDVFEHLADPIADLKKIRTWLKPDGILLIATGDTASLAARILGRHWTFYTPPQHVICFNRQGIREVLSRAGLAPRKWYRIGKWLSLAYVLHLAVSNAEWVSLGWVNRLTKRLGLESIPLYLPMGDNIAVIAKKA